MPERLQPFDNFIEENKEIKDLPPYVKRIELPDGNLRLIYVMHGTRSETEAVQGVDGIALEGAQYGYETREKALESIQDKGKANWAAQQEELLYAKRNHLPIYLIDTTSKLAEISLASSKILRLGEGIIGIGTFYSLVEKYKKCAQAEDPSSETPATTQVRKGVSRREVLKGMAAAWMTLPGTAVQISELARGRHAATQGAHAEVSNKLIKTHTALHPETEFIERTFRDYMMAQKITNLLKFQEKDLQRKPELSLTIGRAHIGIEDALHLPEEERINFINSVSKIPPISLERDYLYKSAELQYQNNQWGYRVIEDPALKNKIES